MYELQVNTVEGFGNLKGFATITFDEKIKITGVKILEKADKNGLYISMPAYKTAEQDELGNPVYASICQPRNKSFAAELTQNILEVYQQAKESGKKASKVLEGIERQIQSRVTPLEKKGSKMLGIGTLYIGDDFKINNVVISQGTKFDYVNMPAYKTDQTDKEGKPVYKDFTYPVTAEARKEIISKVKDAYMKAIQNVKIQTQSR